jgi:hypothetical protein
VHISSPVVAASILSELLPEEVPLPASLHSPSTRAEILIFLLQTHHLRCLGQERLGEGLLVPRGHNHLDIKRKFRRATILIRRMTRA